jgi:hypothetical protein
MERGHSFDYMQTDKDFFCPEYIRHILVKLRPWKGLVLISRLAGSARDCSRLMCKTEVIQTASRRTEELERGGTYGITGKPGVFSIHLSESMRYFGRRVCLLDFRTKGLSVQ